MGAALGGAAAGMAAGVAAGPVGAVLGAVAGGVAGGYGGRAVGEAIDPTARAAGPGCKGAVAKRAATRTKTGTGPSPGRGKKTGKARAGKATRARGARKAQDRHAGNRERVLGGGLRVRAARSAWVRDWLIRSRRRTTPLGSPAGAGCYTSETPTCCRPRVQHWVRRRSLLVPLQLQHHGLVVGAGFEPRRGFLATADDAQLQRVLPDLVDADDPLAFRSFPHARPLDHLR